MGGGPGAIRGRLTWWGGFFTGGNSSMATVVPFASCYAGRGPVGGAYLSLFTYRGPRCAPRPRLACHAPKMTLRQICRMLKVMKQVKNREAAAAAAARKQGSASPASPASPDRRCVPSCLRHKRNLKRIS
ncbi:uncharacterized protein ACNS7B_006972 [Menidia menidia]